jgi:hypothetical protein
MSFLTRDWEQSTLHLQQALEERRRLGIESMAVAFLTNYLGMAVANQDQLRDAEVSYRKALAIGDSLATVPY